MRYNIDLHIHSVLSPCADLLMTVKPIINKLIEKNINIFSITDHNSAKNSKMFEEYAKKENMIFIYGMEVQTMEEVHILVYFKNYDTLMKFQDIIYEKLPKYKNNEEIYGYQLILNKEDEYEEKEEKFLSGAVDISLEELYKIVKDKEGIIIPAHLDRSSSIISNIGYIPDIDFDAYEIYDIKKIEKIKKDYNILKPIFSSSDAHVLESIEKSKMEIDIEIFDIESVFEAIKKNKIYIKN